MKSTKPKYRIIFPVLWIIIAFAFSGNLSGCVSVKINPTQSKKAEDMVFNEPSEPFRKLKQEQADHAWRSTKTGNTLAVISECQTNADTPLESLEKETLAALGEPKILRTENIQYNQREALKTEAEGRIDGVPVKMLVLSLKKNSCNYTLSFLGRAKLFDKERSVFENFLTSFQAP